eukprot:TRINITY_DN44890_c0_g1_i1.p1 TRINITY_DN44890_c0_g1~~TRINITY_DN44890_c0_g1_i1.p1  ORF type:complete len:522 (-),score=54.42 TRINITY_DN44890_c0_g1_i1:142-1707(-)
MAPTSHICTGVRNPAERLENHQAKSQQGRTARANGSHSACPTSNSNRIHGLSPCRPAGHRGRAASQRCAAYRKMRLAVDERSACRPPGVEVPTKQNFSSEQCLDPGNDGDSPRKCKAELHNERETACELLGIERNAGERLEDHGARCEAPAQLTSGALAGRSDQCERENGTAMLTEEALKVIEQGTSLKSMKMVGNLFGAVPLSCRDNDGSISEDGFSVESLHLDRTEHYAIDEMLINEIGLISSIWVSAEESFDVDSLFQEPASHVETHDVTSGGHESCSTPQSILMPAAASLLDQTKESEACATTLSQLCSQEKELSRTSSSTPQLDVNSAGQLSLLAHNKKGANSSSESGSATCMHQSTELSSSSRPPLPRHGIAETVRHLPVRPGQECSRATARPSRPSSRAASPASNRAATSKSSRPSPLQSQDVSHMPQQASPRNRADIASGTPLNACRARRKSDQIGDGATTYWLDSEDQGDWSMPELAALSRPSSLTRSSGALGAETPKMNTPRTSIARQVIE